MSKSNQVDMNSIKILDIASAWIILKTSYH